MSKDTENQISFSKEQLFSLIDYIDQKIEYEISVQMEINAEHSSYTPDSGSVKRSIDDFRRLCLKEND